MSGLTSSLVGTAKGVPSMRIINDPELGVIAIATTDDDLIFAADFPNVDHFHGNAGDDIMIGTGGTDSFHGGDGEDTLLGRGGNDILYGLIGDDIIVGGRGNDKISGDEGDDVLKGGKGNDTFLFDWNSIGGTDDIRDFRDGDVVKVRDLDIISIVDTANGVTVNTTDGSFKINGNVDSGDVVVA